MDEKTQDRRPIKSKSTADFLRALGATRPMAPAGENVLVLGKWKDGQHPIQWRKDLHGNGETWWLFGIECKLTHDDVSRILAHLDPKEVAHTDTKDHCTCHERDSSYACAYCYAQGIRGHMQK